jgi:manganese-dependent inorganic pyrophosphatase
MLKAGANMSTKSVAELVTLDAKEFSMGNAKVEVAQINVVDTNDVFGRQSEVEAAMETMITEKGLDLFLLVVTDILENDSTALALGSKAAEVEKAFNVTLQNNTALLKGVVSRKKQIVPVLTDAMKS